MTRTLELGPGHLAGLRRLNEGKADFLDLAHACASGSAVAWLVAHGLAADASVGVWQAWQITAAGRAALAAGHVVLAD